MAKKDFTIVGLDGKETVLKEGVYEPEMLKNNPTKQAFESAVEGVKGIGKRLKDNVMGTPEQNEKAKKEMAEQDAKNPDTTQAKVNRMIKPVEKKAGGKVSSASKRADG